MLIGLDDMIEDTKSNKKLSPKVTGFLLGKKTSMFHLFLYLNLISKCLKL